MVRTLGVDLSSQPKQTATCLIEWNAGAATVLKLKVGVTDQDIRDRTADLNLAKPGHSQGDAIGIDAPFGWPQPFVELVSRPSTGNRLMPQWDPALARIFCYRLTDHRVRQELGLVP